jgi:hypothetical protein
VELSGFGVVTNADPGQADHAYERDSFNSFAFGVRF